MFQTVGRARGCRWSLNGLSFDMGEVLTEITAKPWNTSNSQQIKEIARLIATANYAAWWV
jgi:hypothetical protein